MRRIASHFIWYRKVYRMHYMELDHQCRLTAIYPLTQEVEGTEFYNGITVPVLKGSLITPDYLAHHWRELTRIVQPGMPVDVWLLAGLSHPAAELGANDSGSRCHIERL